MSRRAMSPRRGPREEDAGEHEVVLGDCLDPEHGLPALPSASCDLLVTDPPYVVTGGYHARSGHQVDDQFFGRWLAEVAVHVVRVLKPDGCGFVFADWKTIGVVKDAFGRPARPREAWAVSQALVWDRESVGLGLPFRNSFEMIAFLRGPQYERGGMGTNTSTVVRFPWPYIEHPNHPAEKPVELLQKLIEWGSKPGDIVLDPFAGSASTAVAARRLGRSFFGFEMRPEFHAKALERLARET